mmetsp:Transcript_91440/g.232625  ORF Transcript_91440/g.232625 Transcript_91440/m.232625 type:complete len:313 (-) Transcript_91440:107-1045(-)
MQEQLDVSLGLVHGSAEKLQAAHVRGALDFHAALAALLDDRFLFLDGVHSGLLILLRLVLLLLLLVLLGLALRLGLAFRLDSLRLVLLLEFLLLRGGLGLLLVSLGCTRSATAAELDVTHDGLELGLRQAQSEPTHDVAERLTEGVVQHQRHAVQQRAEEGDVCEGDAVSHHVGVGQQVVVQHGHRALHVLLRALRGLGDLREDTLHGQHPSAERHLQLVRAELNPRVDHAALEQVLAIESGAPVDARDVARDGGRGKDATLLGLEHRDAARLVRRPAVRRLDLQARVLRADQRLLGLVVVGVGVQLHRHRY